MKIWYIVAISVKCKFLLLIFKTRNLKIKFELIILIIIVN